MMIIVLNVSIGNSDWDGRNQVSFLPFKVTNLTTGRHVRIWHTDEGVYNAEDVNVELNLTNQWYQVILTVFGNQMKNYHLHMICLHMQMILQI